VEPVSSAVGVERLSGVSQLNYCTAT